MKTMDENTIWKKPTHPLSNSSMNLRALFLYNYVYFKFSIAFVNVYTRETTRLPYVYYVR